ncbi:MAG: hypothetical protein IKV24_05345 [Bacteroidaceae bacterium]|nr:hypothetical protein [Bacteroidaceae bacterium]
MKKRLIMHHHSIHLRLRRAGLLLSALLLCCVAWSQTAEKLADYARNIITFNREHPQEKVYLHMDNRSYFIGDTIWFKAYVMNATTLHPTQQSGVFYVELLNEKGVEMERKKMRLENGMCHGEFVLKDDYRTGYYEIRAYTRYMLNWGNESKAWTTIAEQPTPTSEFRSNEIFQQSVVPDMNHCMFSRVFPVYMKPKEPGYYKAEMEWYPLHTALAAPEVTEEEFMDDSLRISFYPEGGLLVENLPSTVAFEVRDQFGGKREISGWITEGRNHEITRFYTSGRGRGVFTLSPQSGKKHYAHVEYKGRHYRYELPPIEKQGATIHVYPPIGDGDASFSVSVSEQHSQRLLGWTLQCRGMVTDFDTLTLRSNATYRVMIAKESLKPGVNQLTLFTPQGEILADRLFFVSPKQVSKFFVENLPDSVQPYEEVKINMRLHDPRSWLPQGHFSLSITDAKERGENTHDTRDIRSELLLASDLKGFIENVDSYFAHANDTAIAADIDRLMLVQGWRRYEWKSMASNKDFIPRYTPEKGLEIDGYVISDIVKQEHFARADKYKRIPKVRVKINMDANGLHYNTECLADSLGRFHFDIDKPFYGNALLSIFLSDKKDPSQVTKLIRKVIPASLTYSYPVLNRAFSPSTTPYSYYQVHSPEEHLLLRYEEQTIQGNERLLGEVTIKKRQKTTRGINFEHPDMVIDYYKEWNNLIDRGIPLANWYSDRLLWLFDTGIGGASDATFMPTSIIDPANPNNEMMIHYSLGRVKIWGPTDGRDSLAEKSQRFVNKYYMPKTIRVYSNLMTRNPLPLEKDRDTEFLPAAYIDVESFPHRQSPRRAPYMLHNGTRMTYYNGYSQVRSFYKPDYSDCALPDTADYRRTLHWEPDIWTDNLGRASVTFYNNSRTKHLHIRAEGFTRNGEFIVYDSEQK